MTHILKQVMEAQDNLYKACGLNICNFVAAEESQEYFAHTYQLENKNSLFRVSKQTPKKAGQFVTLWKRDSNGITCPYHETDSIDFVVINMVHEDKIGHFVFPKAALLENGIFSSLKKEGKRAMRIYSPWDTNLNAQAKRTQLWQTKYFLDITSPKISDENFIRKLYAF